jgi:hypothetical protein
MFRLVSRSAIVLPPLPAEWPGPPRPAAHADLATALRRHSPHAMVSPALDADYLAVPVKLLKPAVQWTLASIAATGLRYQANAWDCEDFAAELCQTFRKLAARAGLQRAPLVGVLEVLPLHPWAGVPPGGAHALAGVYTDFGLFVVEAQNGEATPIETYPNRATIYSARGF